MPSTIPPQTAQQLLDAYLELLTYSPDRFTWATDEIALNPFRNFLYRRLQSLCRAVGVGKDFMLYPGENLERQLSQQPADEVAALLQELDCFVSGKIPDWQLGEDHVLDFRKAQLRDVQTVFTQFFQFLMLLDRVQRFNNSWMMSGSAGAQFSILKTEAVLSGLDPAAIGEIRHFLGRIIDPAGHAYSQAELVERFGYPIEDKDRLAGESE